MSSHAPKPRAASSNDDRTLDAVFGALSDRTRRRILSRLAESPATVGELAAPFSMTLPAVSKHIRILERAGLLRRARSGWYHNCSLDGRPLASASGFLSRYRPFWEQTLAELAHYVEHRQPHEKPKRKPIERGRRR